MKTHTKKLLSFASWACIAAAIVLMFIPGSFPMAFAPSPEERIIEPAFYFSKLALGYNIFPFWTGVFSIIWLALGLLRFALDGARPAPRGIVSGFLFATAGLCILFSFISLLMAASITAFGVIITTLLAAAFILQLVSICTPTAKK